MIAENLANLIQKNASVTLDQTEQAVEHKKVKSWLKSVSAFANTAGGTIIFGITDGE